MKPLKILGANLKKRRQKLGLSQETLAETAGLHRTYVGAVERGERNISILNICRISSALKCKPEDLLVGISHLRSELKN